MILDTFEEMIKVNLQVRQEVSGRVGIITNNDPVDHIFVICTEVADAGSIGCRNKVVDTLVVALDHVRMLGHNKGAMRINASKSDGLIGSVEIVGHAHVLEEVTSGVHTKLAIWIATIDENKGRQNRFRIRTEGSGRDETELRILRDALLVKVVAIFRGGIDIVETTSILVTELLELGE